MTSRKEKHKMGCCKRGRDTDTWGEREREREIKQPTVD